MLYSSQRKATVHKATKVHTHHFTNTGVTQVTATMLENTDIPKTNNASGTLRKHYRAHFTKVQHTSQTMHLEYLFAQWASTLVNKDPLKLPSVPEAHSFPSHSGRTPATSPKDWSPFPQAPQNPPRAGFQKPSPKDWSPFPQALQNPPRAGFQMPSPMDWSPFPQALQKPGRFSKAQP